MKKKVTIQLKVFLRAEVNVKQGETLQEAVDSITQDMDYSFKECEQADGSIINTEIVEEEIISETDIS